jgi:hypothetical protein
MLMSEEAVGQAIYRPRSGAIRAHQRGIDGHHTRLVSHPGPEPLLQGVIPRSPGRFLDGGRGPVGPDQAESVPVALTPGQIDPHHQHERNVAADPSDASDTPVNKLKRPLPFLEDESSLERRCNVLESPR